MSDAARRQGREGSRWYNQRPTSEEIAAWWSDVPLHEGMNHADYISGVTLIPANEKSNEIVGFDDNGLPQIRERTDIVFTPYVKVETRVAYFWKLCELKKWIGRIEPVAPVGGQDLGLPPGFFRFTAAKPDGKAVSFVGCSMRVRAYERAEGELVEVLVPPPGSKQVATATRWDVDQNAIMKAETGAIGRALGFAGILVVPGSGVATAEDMADAGIPAGAAPQLPAPTAVEAEEDPESDEALRERATDLVTQLEERSPEKHQAFQAWARERNLSLTDSPRSVIRGAIKKLEKTLDALPVAS